MSQEEYPSWRKALFGQDTIANLRCAVKYTVWHTGYLLLTVVGALLLGLVAVATAISRAIPGERLGDGASRLGGVVMRPIVAVVEAYQNSNTAKRLAEYGAMLVLGALFIGAVAFLLWFIVMNPWIAAQAILTIGVVTAAIVLTLEVLERVGGRAASSAGRGVQVAKEKAVETPGIRRVYGECPVHFDIEPKWFNKIDEKLEAVLDE